METRIGKVVLIAAALSTWWVTAGPSPDVVARLLGGLTSGTGVTILGYDVRVSLDISRHQPAPATPVRGLACLVEAPEGLVVLVDQALFPDEAPPPRLDDEVDW